MPVETTRRARYEGRGIFPAPVFLPEARWLDADGVRVRVVAPDAPRGVYLHLHGGGWTLGAADLQDALFAFLAEQTGLAVASVDYRLAPEHPYPAGPDDCETAARWLLDRGAAEIGAPATFAIGGESAGAHLAVVDAAAPARPARHHRRIRRREPLLRRVRPARHAEPLRFTDAARDRRPVHGLVHRRTSCPASTRAHAATPTSRRSTPTCTALPRALFTVGTLDPLLDDSLFMAARWAAAGNDAELVVYEDGVHGFDAFPIELGRARTKRRLRSSVGWLPA